VTSTVVEWGREADIEEGVEVLKWPPATRAIASFETVMREMDRLRAQWIAGSEAPDPLPS
jgi:hypothetical protein